ncbi:MAG: PfaD family polyunsaturated fatty acid/polyketide biosynthesis protein [Anaerolineae bacterium]|nr:PfaD family polyunsaturated fatty acid/polyketide biosynthesis protein [Anaerolineae bacterium]
MKHQVWCGPAESVVYSVEEMEERLRVLDAPCYAVCTDRGDCRVGLTNAGVLAPAEDAAGGSPVAAVIPPLLPSQLGDLDFRKTYGLEYAYVGGSMANAISSEEMVIALGQAGMLGSFGAGGLGPDRLEAAIRRVQAALPEGPYAFNLINSPYEPALERSAVALYLRYGVRVIEASAYLTLTPYVVQYRVAGLESDPAGNVVIRNRVLAKVSRREVATAFMQPAPAKLLAQLREQGLITEAQAAMAERVPMADDVTVEADSGGHTDNRPLVCLMPSLIALRDELQSRYHYTTPVRIGAAGGIGTPVAALGALMMGAAYVLTGSINHSCVEAGTSAHVKGLLAKAAMTDVMMAPAADMFEMGVNLQVLKRGTMFPLRARKLYELYQAYDSLEAIPAEERQRLEEQIFKCSLDEVWNECLTFFAKRDPVQIEKAQQNPKRKMALVFRWYLGLATRWGVIGEKGREVDYQIWCGPAMGAFNDWVRGTVLEQPENRRVADIGRKIMEEAAYLYRLQALKVQGVRF